MGNLCSRANVKPDLVYVLQNVTDKLIIYMNILTLDGQNTMVKILLYVASFQRNNYVIFSMSVCISFSSLKFPKYV